MSGYVGDLSAQQEVALLELKIVLQDIPDKPEDNDHYYLRWLRARKFDVTKTETMFRNHMEYRRKYGADTILEDWQPFAVMNECIAGGYFGEDREGHPVWYDNFGNLDPRGLYRSIALEDVLKLKCLHAETFSKLCKEQTKKYGRLIDTVTIVLDFEKLTFQKHYYWPAIEILKQVLVVEEANNPERVCRIFVIKAPSIFPLCYNIVKHVLDERTRKKVTVLGYSQSNWQEVLQQYISPDQLPAMYGGTRYEPDAQCSKYIRPGRDVPEKYYLSNLKEANKEDMERVVVGRGSSHKATYEITDVGSTIQWEFLSTDYDISFEVYIKRASDKETIQPLNRTKSHLIPQSGYHKCETPGSYVLRFDNSYSWTRSKEVFYAVKILPPNVSPEMHSDLSLLEDDEENGQRNGDENGQSNGTENKQNEDKFFECNDDIREPEGTQSSNGI